MIILQAEGLKFAYPGGVPALNGIDLTIRRGQRLAILGPNGAGKTTLLLHLNGTLKPQSGQVRIDGQPGQYHRAGLAAWRRRVGLVLQDADDQLFAATVAEDVAFGPANLGLDEAAVRQRVDQALTALRITDLADRPPHMLSFGQKKRVAIAGAVAMAPAVLLLDEPSAGLDRQGVTRLLAALERLQAAGTTLVFTTHDADLAYSFADQVAVFSKGTVLAQGPAPDILGDRELMAHAHAAIPLVLDLGLQARRLGLLPAAAPVPRDRQDLYALLENLAGGRQPARD